MNSKPQLFAMARILKALAPTNPLTMGSTVIWKNPNWQGTAVADTKQVDSERVAAWIKKQWIQFCKDVIAKDSRWSLSLESDALQSITGETTPHSTLSDVILRRDGVYADVMMYPYQHDKMGFIIIAGNKLRYIKLIAKVTPAMVVPSIMMGDELEKQFIEDVDRQRKNLRFQDARRNKEAERVEKLVKQAKKSRTVK